MDETKTFVFPNQGTDTASLLASGGMNGWGNSPLWALIFLAFLRNGLGGDFGATPNAGFVSSQLGQAIAGNANAISNLATSLNCTEGQIQSAIAGVQNTIQQVANANNMSTMQVVNSVNSGNAALANSIQSCCCDIKQAINGVNTGVERGFSSLAYENAANFCSTKQAIADNTSRVIAKLDNMETNRMQEKIAALQEEKATLKGYIDNQNQTAQISAMIAPLQKEINEIKCAQPATVTLPAPVGTVIPSCVAWQYGLQNLGLGPYAGGNIWS